ncbi:hypothetical protein [Magnetofaba australis]|uniref:Glycosyltransferase RgtA/B/C/D-like domain-containing protein n=1 Tax=Magnetofaba australis IT-1 TaxID=1434232 RepID=A0A1Y2K2H9_9PROT|nr:hypothetical protein [Magnetofaba australis]OSM02238.1 hypothetical protein MAIT1_02348 [Magnetofaba australis IT-1]
MHHAVTAPEQTAMTAASDQLHKHAPWLLLAIFAYCVVVSAVCRPAVPFYLDDVMMRDTNLLLSSLQPTIADLKRFYWGMLSFRYGALPYVAQNVYYAIVGEFLPLSGASISAFNGVLTGLAAIAAFGVGRLLGGVRLGLMMALALALFPWMAAVSRGMAFNGTLMILLQITLLYLALKLAREPQRAVWPALLSCVLGLYLFVALDAIIFLFFLFLILLFTGGLKRALFTPFVLIPLGALALSFYWTAFQYGQGGSLNILFLPLIKLAPGLFGVSPSDAAPPPFAAEKVVRFLSWSFGPPLLLMAYGAYSAMRGGRNLPITAPDGHALLKRVAPILLLWSLLLLTMMILKAGQRPDHKELPVVYAFIGGAPFAFIAALGYAALPRRALIAIAVLMSAMQFTVLQTDLYAKLWWRQSPDDQRVFAMAAYLIEKRPDLLTEDKIAFLPRNQPANVGVHARGRMTRIVMPDYLPATHELATASRGDTLGFLQAVERRDVIPAHWLVFTPELFGSEGGAFFARLRDDPRVVWKVRLRDPAGREIWLAEVEPERTEAAPIPAYADAEPWATSYRERYNRKDFLVRNLDLSKTY